MTHLACGHGARQDLVTPHHPGATIMQQPRQRHSIPQEHHEPNPAGSSCCTNSRLIHRQRCQANNTLTNKAAGAPTKKNAAMR